MSALSSAVRSSATKNAPKPIPAPIAISHDERSEPTDAVLAALPSNTVATSPTAKPTPASAPGHSPVAAPTITGTLAPHTAVTGETIDMRPIANPRYSSSSPRAPAMPPPAPHATSAAVTASGGTKPVATASPNRPMT
jgi:hypothetical protein